MNDQIEARLIVDMRLYVAYATGRERTPQLSADAFAQHFPNAADLEAKYMMEKAVQKARVQAAITCGDIRL